MTDTPISMIINTPSAEIASKTFVASTYVPYTGATTNPNIGSYYLIGSGLRANGSGGLLFESNNGTDVLLLGAGGGAGANATAYGGWNFDGATANTIASFGASKTLASLSTSTYPSLTELSYVKGLSSAVQTQLNDKASLSGINTFINENYFQQAVYFGDPGVPSSGALYLYNVPYGDYMSVTTGDGGINVNGSGLSLVVGEEANLLYLQGTTSSSAQRMNTNCTAFSFEKNIELTQTVTTESLTSDRSVTVKINGTVYKLLAKA